MVLAVTYPWASASSYLSSQSVADSRCNPHATPRSSYSRRSHSVARGSFVENLEHLECDYQPHMRGRGAQKRTQRAG